MNLKINDEVTTPIGVGLVQGQDALGNIIVRLPINDITRPHLGRAFGTNHATLSGLWTFRIEEVTEMDQSSGRSKNAFHKERRPRKAIPETDDVQKTKDEGFTEMIRRLRAEDTSANDIYDYAVAHEKFKGEPGKARKYAINVLKMIQSEERK